MNSDHHFLIGHSHSVCEDYAASLPGFAALADGCSCVLGADGKPVNAHTDIGARLLVRAAFHHALEPETNLFLKLVIYTADGYSRQLGLDRGALCATLLTIRDEENYFKTITAGDGVVAARERSSSEWECVRFWYENNPFYLRYFLNSGVPYPQQLFASVFCKNDAHAIGGPLVSAKWSKADYDLVVAISDGAFSFTKNSAVIPFDKELATRLLDFRRLKGEFVHRHLTGVLKELAQDGIVNQDDISMIAMSA